MMNNREKLGGFSRDSSSKELESSLGSSCVEFTFTPGTFSNWSVFCLFGQNKFRSNLKKQHFFSEVFPGHGGSSGSSLGQVSSQVLEGQPKTHKSS